MKSLWTGAVAAVVAGVLSCGHANAVEYLINGGFENGDLSGWVSGGNSGFTNVTTSSSGYGPQSGSFFVAEGPVGSEGTLSQTFVDVPGQPLSVSGWVAGNGTGPSHVNLYFNNVLVAGTGDPVQSQSYTIYQAVVIGTGFDTFSVGFQNNPSFDALDTFSVHSVAVVPVPAALPLFATGLGLIGLLGRRRNKRVA